MKRYLIVEDDIMSREMLKAVLSDFAPCDSAGNGVEGMILFENAFLSNNPYCLLCVDLVMPEMNGHAFIRKIREFEKSQLMGGKARTKIFVISSSGSAWDKADLLLEGLCDDYIVKPFDRAVLMANLFKYDLVSD